MRRADEYLMGLKWCLFDDESLSLFDDPARDP
jgi:hypothetical protein